MYLYVHLQIQAFEEGSWTHSIVEGVLRRVIAPKVTKH